MALSLVTCQYTQDMWGHFLSHLGCLESVIGTWTLMEEVLLSPPFRDKERFLWQTCFFDILQRIWIKRNNRILRGRRDSRFMFGSL